MTDTPSTSSDRLARPRRDYEPPAATAERGWRYHHLGIPYAEPRSGEQRVPHLKIAVSGFETSPYGIQWMRFEPECDVPDVIRHVPHVAFEVDDLDAALVGKDVLTPPNSPSEGCRVAMIVHDGAPIELIEFRKR